MRKLLFTAALILGTLPALAQAGGCYVCASGSAPACRDFCAYDGLDTFDNRHRCQAKGCKIAGTSACPGSGSSAKVCAMPASSSVTLAQIPWCSAPAPLT